MGENDRKDLIDQNRRAWDEIAEIRGWRWAEKYPPDQLRSASNLPPEIRSHIGDIKGKRLLHLQCATGEESIALAALGASVTAVDISERQIELGRQRATQLGLAIDFIAADVYELPREFDSSFDLVYTGGGVMTWLPDLQVWASVIASARSPGGRFLVFDEHPLAQTLSVENSAIVMTGDYFQRGRAEVEPPGWTHFDDRGQASEEKYEFVWGLGDVVTALAGAGLIVERLDELPMQPEHQEWRFRGAVEKASALPGIFLLVASKPRVRGE